MRRRRYLAAVAIACILLLATIVSATSDGASSGEVSADEIDACPTRYLLYTTQPGEGFSLRRDVFVRVSVSLLMSSIPVSNWVLVLPTLSAQISPHWNQGALHPGQNFYGAVPWRTLFDLDHITHETSLRFMEAPEYAKLHPQSAVAKPSPSYHPIYKLRESQPPVLVDQILQVCSFNFSEAFRLQRDAAIAARVPDFPGTNYPKEMVWREFTCPTVEDEKPPVEQGFCNSYLYYAPQGGARTLDYGLVDISPGLASNQPRLITAQSAGASTELRCSFSNMSPNIAGDIFRQYLSPHVPAHSQNGAAKCRLLVNNAQTMYWPSRGHPQSPIDTESFGYKTNMLRDKFVRAARPARVLRELAMHFITHVLKAKPATTDDLVFDDAATAAAATGASSTQQQAPEQLPHFLSFHVRRGDFLRVHSSHVPDFTFLAEQMRDKFIAESDRLATENTSTASKNTGISKIMFVSSDMRAEEWIELQAELRKLDHSSSKLPLGLQIARLDIMQFEQEQMEAFSPSLREFFRVSAALHARLNPQGSASLRSSVPDAVVEAHTPLTPFHILLIDQYICELALPVTGFTGTRYSYVSEMIFIQRRAHGLEDPTRFDKNTLEGVPKPSNAPTPPSHTQAATVATPTRKDEL